MPDIGCTRPCMLAWRYCSRCARQAMWKTVNERLHAYIYAYLQYLRSASHQEECPPIRCVRARKKSPPGRNKHKKPLGITTQCCMHNYTIYFFRLSLQHCLPTRKKNTAPNAARPSVVHSARRQIKTKWVVVHFLTLQNPHATKKLQTIHPADSN